MPRRRRYRRNPGVASGAGDAELMLTLAAIGGLVWVGYEAWQGFKQTAAAANAGFASVGAALSAFKNSVINGVTSPLTTFESWLGSSSTSPDASSSSGFSGFGGGSSDTSGTSSTTGGGSDF